MFKIVSEDNAVFTLNPGKSSSQGRSQVQILKVLLLFKYYYCERKVNFFLKSPTPAFSRTELNLNPTFLCYILGSVVEVSSSIINIIYYIHNPYLSKAKLH